jgi:hypothetical protein
MMEKRALHRTLTEVPIACCCFTISEGANFTYGTMLNCSPGGTYIELDRHYKEGTILMVKADGHPNTQGATESIEGFRTISLAEVKWSKSVEENESSHYGLGLKYYNL